MKLLSLLSFSGLIALGILMFVYGGYDDSPGAQLLGVAMVVGGIWGILKRKKK
jgi:LPXTG-motif cell wall-anchored protein